MLATANAATAVREGIDFFPLTVDVEERAYAAGKIPGSFFRREGRPTEDAILTCRLTDRPLRPSFAKGFRNETQIVDHGHRRRPGEPPRRALHQRRLGGADDLGHPLRGPDRRRPPGLRPGRHLDPPPDLRRGRREHLRARRRRPGARQRRRRRDDGRGRRHREGLRLLRGRRPEGHRGRRRRRPGGQQGLDQGGDRPAARAGREGRRRPRPDRDDGVHADARLRRRRVRGRRARGRGQARPGRDHRRQGRAQRRHRRRQGRGRGRAGRHQGRARRPSPAGSGRSRRPCAR